MALRLPNPSALAGRTEETVILGEWALRLPKRVGISDRRGLTSPIAAQHLDCKVLLFSGQAATSNLLENDRAQGYDFRLLQKPVHPSEFLFEIGQLSTGPLQALPLVESITPGTANHDPFPGQMSA